MNRFIERAGEFVGETAGAKFLELLRKKVEKFKLTINGQENLESLRGKQYLVVANHLMPESGKAQQSQLSPDAFVIENTIRDLTGQEPKIVAKADDGWWSQNSIYKEFQHGIQQPFTKGVSEGMGFIPILKNPGSFNRDFVKKVDEIVAEGQDPILMFPEGNWYEDFDPKHKLETGVATISTKHELPILPVYIHGARNWEADTEVQVIFGEPFLPGDLSKDQITEEIRSRIAELQKSFQGRQQSKV
jgi:1-acyl-sn-glycerol-3-phosphate acyltransferase